MSSHISPRAITVSLALALATPVAMFGSPAFANTTQVTIRAIESDDGKQEAGSYDKTGGIGFTPVITALGAASVACLTLAHRLDKDDDGENSAV